MMIDREHVFGLRNEVGRDVRDITRKRGIVYGYVGQRESELFLGKKRRRAERVKREGRERERERETREEKPLDRRNGGRSKKVEAKMRRRVSENVAENRGK